MFAGKSKEDVLRIWLKASEEFSRSPTPHVSAFGKLTGQVDAHGEPHEDLWLAIHLIEEIAGARAASNPDKVDKVLLRSQTSTSSIWGRSESLLEQCARTGLITGEDEGEARLEAINNAIQRRRVALGIKGRGYYFD